MTGPSVFVVHKRSQYEIERDDERVTELLANSDPSVARLREAHEDHEASLREALDALAKLGARVEATYLRDTQAIPAVDLVVTLGGDGTLLWASHLVPPGTPMLAINSAPKDSVGYFCGARKGEIHSRLAEALSGRMRRTELARMKVSLDDEVVSSRVLNDVLFSHECPAATTRYVIYDGDRHEEQRSSGVWVGPAAGSTAAQRSAGGRTLPLGSRRLQYVVREPYVEPRRRPQLVKGLVEPGQSLVLLSKISAGRVYVDGPYRAHPVRLGCRIELTCSSESLTLLGLTPRPRPKLTRIS